ncbi:MAG TPA: tetraacyldisaccharide 4'-kinase [Thermoanaerobaculia bacterium]|nr:tetraacyldisaccharide 4'-kinase [Thermoanaerobaculia bacterium]
MILDPVSRIYGSLLERRARFYASGRIPSHRLPHPTVSVGNITFGGTGKTPLVEWLARRFRFEGRRPAILSRGYRRRSRGVVVVSEGNGPLVDPDRGGDEPVELARRLPGVLVVVGESRVDAALAADRLGADLYLLDDGYQHLSVRRDANLLLLDGRDPFGGGHLPPRGRLREPLSALARADAFVLTRIDRAEPPADVKRTLAAAGPKTPIFSARIRATGVRDENGAPVPTDALAERRILAVCGIANPGNFASSLAELELTPEETLVFRDHQRYAESELDRIRRAAESNGCSWVVTTEKDAVKLWERLPLPVVAVRLSVEFVEPSFFPFVASRVTPAGAGQETG